MSVFRDWSWVNLLILLLASVLLAGCFPFTESRENALRDIAREFVTALDVDVVEEEHSFVLSIQHDVPSSWVVSKYVISDAPDDVREKVKALHDAREFWLAPSRDGWSRDVKLQIIDSYGRPLSPAEVAEDLESFFGLSDDSAIDSFVICPWYVVGPGTYAFVYSDTVILTNDGTLITRLNVGAQERCHDVNRKE